MDSCLNFKLSRPKVSQKWTKMDKNGQKWPKMAKNTHALTLLSPGVKKFHQILSVPIAQLVKACQRCIRSEGLEFKSQQGQIFFQVVWLWMGENHSYKSIEDFYRYKSIGRFSYLQDWEIFIATSWLGDFHSYQSLKENHNCYKGSACRFGGL